MGFSVARGLLYLIFGFFIYETINEYNKLFSLSLNPYFAIVPASLLYAFQEFAINRGGANEGAEPTVKPLAPKLDKVLCFIAWVLVGSLVLGILLVWAGVIYKEIIKRMW